MNKIYADEKRIFLDNWNSAYGNKILHFLFLINICETRNKLPVMYKGSNLDGLFNFNFELIKEKDLKIKDYFFEEKDSFYIQNKVLKKLNLQYRFFDNNLDSVVVNHYKHYLQRKELLYKTRLPEKDIKIRGHFFDFQLMPSVDIFEKYVEIKSEIKDFIRSKYSGIENKKCVAVHYRGSDFKDFMQHIFPRGLQTDEEYYKKSINTIEEKLGSDVIYHLFSDDIEFLEGIFKGKNVVVHNDKAVEDWVALYLMKNVIQTNSSFCWTASLYNKNISIQPEDGYNYHQGTGAIPYGFHHKNSILIRTSE